MAPPPPNPPDWTAGPAKWAAVAVLGTASVLGMAWSAFWREPASAPARSAASGLISAADLDARSRRAPAPASAGIDLNTATTSELELLPGVGPTLAKRIVEDRAANGPFGSVDDLDRVKGIGPGIIAKIRPMARVGTVTGGPVPGP